MLSISFTSKPFDKLSAQCAVVTTFADQKPLKGTAGLVDWRLNGKMSSLLQKNWYESRFQESLLMPSEGRINSRSILVLGLGPYGDFNEAHVNQFIQFLIETLDAQKVHDFQISFSDMIADRFEWRNGVRLLVSKLVDCPSIKGLHLCEPEDCIRDARRRHMDFGVHVEVTYETLSL